jgi:hypothetical protein
MREISGMTSVIDKKNKLVAFQVTAHMESVEDGKGKYGIQFSLIRENGIKMFAILTTYGFVFTIPLKERAIQILDALLEYKKFKFTTVYKTDVEQSGDGYLVSPPYSYTNEGNLSEIDYGTILKIKAVLLGELKIE